MATSLDNYPNSYDLMAIEPIKEVLESYLLDIKLNNKFQGATLEQKKEIIEEISLEIDQVLNKNYEK